jgi:hypothetical protein
MLKTLVGLLLVTLLALGNAAFAQDAAARKQFAKSRFESVKGRTTILNITTDGPDATILVLHIAGTTYDQCNIMFNNQDWVSTLQKVGFSQFVCTDDGNARFTFGLLQGQSSPSQKDSKPTGPTSVAGQPEPKPKPISEYMRRVGLIYVERLEEDRRVCLDDWSTAFTCMKDEPYKAVEDRVEITLSRGDHPEGDKPLFVLLKYTKDAQNSWFEALLHERGDTVGEATKKKVHKALSCARASRDSIGEGIFITGDCE